MDDRRADDLRDELLRFELALASRNPAGVEGGLMALIARDFVEFGRGGRICTAESIRGVLEVPPGQPASIDDFKVAELADGVILVTYRMAGPPLVNRSSIWIRRDRRWQMRFHQGTQSGA